MIIMKSNETHLEGDFMKKYKKYALIAIPVILLIIAAIMILPGLPGFWGMSVINAGATNLTDSYDAAKIDTKQEFSDDFIRSYTNFSIGMFKETAAASSVENIFFVW